MSRAVVIYLALAACVVGEQAPPPAVTEEPRIAGFVTTPRHGEVIAGDTQQITLEVAGQHSAADYRIDVQILDDPTDLASWITIGTTVTGSTAVDGLYPWRLLVAPGRDAARRWPAGGIVRVRAIGESDELLDVRFHDSDEIARVTNGMILVSPSPTPAEAAVRPRFLDRREAVDIAETAEYYAAIDAPPTLADFKTRYAFQTTPTTFYNAGDLGIGREMHCQPQPGGGMACYVSNYGTFGGERDAAIAAAIAGVEAGGTTGSFATVAMVYTPPASAPNSVTFVVYDAAGALASRAPLDTFGDNDSIPNNCINCHGGARYDRELNAVIGARFLPFDTTGFEFADMPGFRASDQAPNIRALNRLVGMTEPTPGIRELIAGFEATPARELVVAGWNGSPIEQRVYTEAVAVACRSCHASLAGALDFSNAEQFRAMRAAIADSLCGPTHDMPSAEVPLRRLWTTSARAYLMDYLDIPGSCAP